jgi:hypothetical protein
MVDEVVTTAPLELPPTETQTPEQQASELEQKEVQQLMDEYKVARAFDRPAMKQIARDRRYVSGMAGADWAVSANLLGSYIDILVAFIYARNPKVSIRPAEQAGRAAQRERQLFAKTLQIVVGRLWTDGKLKKAMKRVVRSGFSVAYGWFKAVMLFDTERDPLIEHELNDVRDNLQKIAALETKIVEDENGEPIDRELLMKELELQIASLESQVEIVLRKGMAIDFISAEQIQVWLDVRDVDDYLEAGAMSNEIFIPFNEATEKFPRLTAENLKTATIYYQKAPVTYSEGGGNDTIEGAAQGIELGRLDPHGEAAAQYVTSEAAAGYNSAQISDAKGKPVKFIKAVEVWDRRDTHIKTLVEGVKKWAREPFIPQFATSRFYPYFKVDFFPVDGERHAQSLTHRLSKLQDEYGGTRSSYRLTRQRSIPATIFNSGQVEEADMKKVNAAVHDEFIPLKPRDPAVDMRTLFAEKPQPRIDAALFDTSPIIGDMEKISGVQEALQTSQTVEKTATQAEIEQGGFAARTTQERDCVEETLSEFARYTAELALQALSYDDVVKIAGPLSFWPEGLPVEAITTLLDVDIEAGSTGRPNQAAEREAWTTIEPLAKELIGLIYASLGTPLQTAYTELFRETLVRFDDRIDIERFLPGITNPEEGLGPGGQIMPGMDPLLAGRNPQTGLMPMALPAPPGAGPGLPSGSPGDAAPPPATEAQASPLPEMTI